MVTSRDGRIAYATVDFAKQADNLAPADINRVVNAAESAREPGLNVQLGGQAIENTEQSPLGTSVTIGVLAAAAVLFIAFGSLLAGHHRGGDDHDLRVPDVLVHGPARRR